MKRLSISRTCEWGILVLLAFSIVWRGGKGLEATWLLAAIAAFTTLVYAIKRLCGISTIDSEEIDLSRKPERPLLLWSSCIAFIILAIAAYFHSSVRNYGLDTLLRNLSLILIFFWSVRLSLEGGQQRVLSRVSKIVTVALSLSAVVGVVVYVIQPVNRFTGTFFDFRFDTDYWPNAWAEMILLGWPLMVIAIMQTKNTILKNIMIVCLGCVLGTLLLSYSRGGILSFGIQIGLMVLLFGYLRFSSVPYKRWFRSLRTSFLLRSVAIVALSLLIFVGVNAIRAQRNEVQSVTQKITFTASEGTSSIDERSSFWHQAIKLSEHHPWLGYGPYSFRFVQPQVATSVLATSDHAHNVFLNTALDMGWPAAVFLFLIFLLSISSSLKVLFSSKREWSQEKDVTTIFLLIAVLGVCAHSMIDYNLQFVGIALPFWMCLGSLVVPVASKDESAAASFVRWKCARYLFSFKAVLSILILCVAIIEGYFLFITSLGRHAEAAQNPQIALHYYVQAKHEWFSRDMYLSEAHIYLQKDDSKDALDAIDHLLKENSYDPRIWKIRGEILLRMKRPSDAEESLSTAYALGKYTDLDILNLLLQTGHEPTVRTLLIPRKLEFDTLFSEYADAIEHNTHFIALSTNVEALMSVSRELSNLFPNDAQRYKQIARKASAHAEEERKQYTARALGL